jgi:Plavaka transposase
MDVDIQVPQDVVITQDVLIPPTSSGRQRKFPRRFTDYIPSLSVRLPHMPERPCQQMQPTQPNESQQSLSLSPPISSAAPATDGAMPTFDTEPDEFGLFRSYISCPTYEPDEEIHLDSICDSEGFLVAKAKSNSWWTVFGPRSSPMESANLNLFAPFLGPTVFRLMNWFYSGSNMKSVTELDKLVNDVILADDFDKADLKGFSAARELKCLDEHKQGTEFPSKDGWKETSVKIRLPAEKARHTSEDDAPEFKVKGVFYRPLTDVIISAFQEAAIETFHITPFRLFWQRSKDEPPERVISELYNSDAMIAEHQRIQAQPREPGCTLETVVCAIMLWSDSTHLANFGTAGLWPIYAYFGNQSKYTRGKPTSFAAHHIAYIPSVSNIHD